MKSNKELIEELKNNIAILNMERDYTSNVVSKGGSIVKRVITIISTIALILAGSITAYAAMGGEIAGKPVIEWLGIKFSDEYEDYKVDVIDQEIGAKETKIDLVGAVCDDGYTILEFDVKLSKEDKEYLRVGEKVVTDKDIEDALERDRKTTKPMLSQNYPNYDFSNPPKTEYYADGEGPNYKFLMQSKDVINTIGLKFNTKEGKDSMGGKRDVILNDEYIWLRQSNQTVTKISDYEYKVYQLYFFTEQELSDETDFKLTFKDILISNQAEIEDHTSNMWILNTENNAKSINVDGEININLSKKDALENCKIYYNDQEVRYKKMTQRIESIKVTPLQVIVKLQLTKTGVSSISLERTSDPDHIGIENYKVYDNNENKLYAHSFRTRQTITYKDGNKEEWGAYDIGTYNDFDDATIEITEYIVIEKKDSLNSLRIVPNISYDGYDEVEQKHKKFIDELDEFEIDLKK